MNARSLVNSGRFAIVAASAISLMACSAILGLTDPAVDNTIGDGGQTGDGSAPGDGAAGDGAPIADGGSDATPTCPSTTDFTKDKANCGACGHSCQGGDCEAGACQPVVVVDDTTHLAVVDMALANDVIYFTNVNSTIGLANLAKASKTAIDNVPPATILADWSSTEGQPFEVAASGGNVYFSANSGSSTDGVFAGGVKRCDVDGSPCTAPYTVAGVDSFSVATDGTNVVFGAEYNYDAGDDQYGIRKAGLTLAAPTQILANLGDTTNYIKIDGTTAYIATESGVFSIGLDGSNQQTLTTLPASELAVAAGVVYFTSTDFSGTVQAVTISTKAVVQIASTPATPLSVIADSKYVYFTDVGDTSDQTTGKVVRCALSGCGANDVNGVVLSSGNAAGGNPRGLLDDGTAIYWGTRSGKIWKLAK